MCVFREVLLFWCHLLTYNVIVIIVRSISYHLCEKSLNIKGRERNGELRHTVFLLLLLLLLMLLQLLFTVTGRKRTSYLLLSTPEEEPSQSKVPGFSALQRLSMRREPVSQQAVIIYDILSAHWEGSPKDVV